ncbi:hypothetical protein H6P81_004785 [Aristolochia fimbriata]|uniref:Uncharacterized protein n=1 Tax=Aristolochia fimbriata TaxID=158543 RepID=A0AAV7ETS6_ARIFI|nr:hypothetical protein H6P81_004785 [Aristolochia fimbriata]
MAPEKLKKSEMLIKMLEKGSVPDDELRRLMRFELGRRLQWCQKPTYEEQTGEILNLAKAHRQGGICTGSDSLNSQLFEVPIVFLNTFLGKLSKQSPCYFKDDSMTLDEAEEAMLDLYCERAQLKDGQMILELGCGQGAVTLHVAQKYKNSHVTAVTNSASQKKYIEDQCQILELSNVEIILEDIAKLTMDTTFDRIIAIGLFEHMQNYGLLLQHISQWMTQDSLLFVDHACHKNFAYHYEPLDEDDWFTEYIFPPGSLFMASASFLLYFQDDVCVVDHWVISGKHFSRTATEWLKRLDANVEKGKEILESTYGRSPEAAFKEINYWRSSNIFANELFGYNGGEEHMTSQLLFKKK